MVATAAVGADADADGITTVRTGAVAVGDVTGLDVLMTGIGPNTLGPSCCSPGCTVCSVGANVGCMTDDSVGS